MTSDDENDNSSILQSSFEMKVPTTVEDTDEGSDEERESTTRAKIIEELLATEEYYVKMMHLTIEVKTQHQSKNVKKNQSKKSKKVKKINQMCQKSNQKCQKKKMNQKC